jgi:hypothetical protein
MVRKAVVVIAIALGSIASASAAWAVDPGQVQKAAEAHRSSVDSFDEVLEVVGPVDPDTVIFFCMLGWQGTLWTDENGGVHAHGEPDASCPIFSYFYIS